MVVRQVADGIPAYEVKDEAGNVKTVHRNRLFLVATPMGEVKPLGVGALLSEEKSARSALAELTSLEIESDSPEGSVDGADTLSPTGRVTLRWVGGVLWPLLSVVPRPTTLRGLGAGDECGARMMRKSLDLLVGLPNLVHTLWGMQQQ